MYYFFKNNKTNKFVAYFLLLCLSTSGYSTELMLKYIDIKLSNSNTFFPSSIETILPENKSNLSQPKNEIGDLNETKTNSNKYIIVYDSDLVEGNIGVNKDGGFDYVYDNIFKLNINSSDLLNKEVYLTYDIYGVDKATLPSKSVNFNKVTGGYVVKFSKNWQNVEEKINGTWLNDGINTVYFTVPKNAVYNYKIKNLKIVVKEKSNSNNLIELKNCFSFKKDTKNIYLNGFIKSVNSNSSEYKLLLNGKQVKLYENQFEDVIKDYTNKNLSLQLFKNDVLIDKLDIDKEQFINSDRNYELEPLDLKSYSIGDVNNSETPKNYALYEETKYNLEELRSIDIPEFESSFINVTKNKTAYRVNNIKVKDSTAFKLFIEYDAQLIPNGYSEKDIQTFHFDRDYKKWIPVSKDTLIQDKNIIVAISDKEGDYVNGIIQAPESPQTSSFTPTMMSDIKAADPSSEMTIISPPEVSQKGDANVSFPIKIPAGRNGLQPQLAIQYNSEGGNGWLGQGWSLNIPAITIDTKWGTPTFNPTKESEIYTLNGEQLMYPKQNGKDWMPNRHFDVDGAPSGTFSTGDIDRTADLVFTPRKQGSFAKIERKGGSVNDYYWKVTGTDGTVYWYGGKNNVVPNAVIKNSNGNIVHWGLYLVEDVHGNTMKYTYTNSIYSSGTGINTNLNGGNVFQISNISYSGYNDTDYKYDVQFIRTPTTFIRQDASISARLGVKQVEPNFLNEIRVRNINPSTSNVIRKYTFEMGYGKFGKGQLKSISEYNGNQFFYKHTFDYYNDITVDNQDIYYTDGEIEVICNNGNEPCLDSDNDGVCNEDDLCPDKPGPVDNNGCPKPVLKCYQLTISSSFLLNECLVAGVNVKVNGVVLLGGPFYSVDEIVSAMQIQHPTTNYNPTNNILTISNTALTYINFEIYIGKDVCFKANFFDCVTGKNNSQVYKQFFSDLKQNNSFSISDGLTLEDPCDDLIINDEFLVPGYSPSFDSSASILGSSKSQAISGGFYIGIGVGGNRFTKMTTFGVQWSWGNDKSFGMTSLIDINGDGLDDIVSKEGGNLYYKKHIVTRTYDVNNEPVVTHSFEARKPIVGMNNFYRAFGRNNSRNFQITFGFRRAGGFVGHDKSKSKSETDIFFTDGNGDGLMDIVRDGVVYFNRIDGNGNPNFIPDSQGTENLVITAAPIGIEVPDEYNEDEITFPAFDVVKVWEAPRDGNIKIDNNISLLDTNKEAIVSVEMNKTPQNQCYNINFAVPFVSMPLFKYQLGGGVTGGNNLPNPFSSEVNGACSQTSWRIKQVKFNGITYNSNANPNLLFYINGNSTVGKLNQCPSTLPPIYIYNSANHYNDAYFDISVRSLNSVPLISNWYSNVLNSAGISFSNLVYYNWAADYIQPTNSRPGYNYQYWYRTDQFLKFNSFENITGSIIEEYSDSNNVWKNRIYQFLNGINPLGKVFQENVNIGVNTQVYINGTLLGIFNLYNNFSAFQTAFEAQYGTAYNIIAPSANNNYTVSISMNGTNAFTNISLVPVSNPSQNFTYVFSQTNCNNLPIINPNPTANNILRNSQLEPTKDEQEYAINKWLSEGNEINLPYENVKQNILFDFTNNRMYNNISGNYLLAIDGNSYEWYNEQNNRVNGNGLKSKLFELSGLDISTLLVEMQQANIDRINRERSENRQKAIDWINNKELEFLNQNSLLNLDDSRTVNQTNCNETPNELCLLYGTQLNASNSSVSNTLTNNCSGQTLSVKKGDRIYFRVHSVPNGNSPINWDPKVEYTNPGYAIIFDANNTTPFSSSYSDSFVLTNKLPTTFPGNSGNAKITWEPFTINPSDKVTYQIIKETIGANPSNNDVSPNIISTQVIYTKVCPPNVISTIAPIASPIDLNNIAISQSSGYDANLQQTHFYFKVISTSNVDWKNSVWKPEMECTTVTPINPGDGAPTEGNLTSVIKLYPVADYDLYRIFPCGPTYVKKDISLILNQPGTKRIRPNLTNSIFATGDNGKINFVVKSGNQFIGSKTITVTNGIVSNVIPPFINLGANVTSNIEIMFTVDDSNNDGSSQSLLKKLALASTPLAIITSGSTNINVSKSEVTLYQKTDSRFGNFYRSWGQFMYNPANVTGALSTGIANTYLIKEEALQTPTLSQSEANQLNNDLAALNDNMSDIDLANFEASHMNYINNLAFLSANPQRDLIDGNVTDRWIGFHKENYAAEFSYRAASLSQSMADLEEGFESVEQAVLQTGAFAISKYAKGKSNNNFSGGASAFGVGVNASISNNGFNNALTDYVDYNGDRYPDIVSTNKIQFTNKTGGLFSPLNKVEEPVNQSSSDSKGFGASGSFGKNSDDGGDKSGKKFGFERFDGFKGNAGAGISGNFTNGNSETSRFWTDINGDGLSDLLITSGSTTNVTLNFGPTTPNTAINNWGNLPLFKSKSNAISGGIGVNKWNGSAEAGISLTTSWNKTTNTLIDINGDGLLDMIEADDNLGVKLNLGNKFADNTVWTSSYDLKRESASVGAALNAGFTFAFVWRLWFITFKIPALNFQTSPISTTTNKTTKSIVDYDGDGYGDLLEQISPNRIKIYYSKIRRTDKLKTVTNPLGGTFTIDYKVQKVDYNNPNPKWVMSSVSVNDNYDKVNDGEDVYNKHFVYENGRYDRREREFYGYEQVKVIDYKTNDQGTEEVYRTSVSKYNNTSYFLNGLQLESYILKGDDENKKFNRTVNTYNLYKLNNTNDEIDFSTVLPHTYDVGGHEGRRSACVLLAKTRSEVYELNPSSTLATEVEFTYDTKGRVIKYVNKGDLSNTNDDYLSKIEYHDSLNAQNIISIPKTIAVIIPSSGVVKRERKTEIDGIGNITKVSARNNSSWADTEMKYDMYGNLVNIKYPNNSINEFSSYDYTYDNDFHKYLIKVKDVAFGYESSTTYDTSLDKPLEVIDIAGNKTVYKYDNFGRTTKVIGPKEIAAGRDYTIMFEYFPYLSSLPSSANASATNFMPIALTKHFDSQNPTNDIETYTFVDGLGRPIQVKKDIELNIGSSSSPTLVEALTVSGKTKFDAYARTIESFQPWWENKTPATQFLINEYAVTESSKVEYDELDRAIKSIDEEGNESTVQFSIGTDISGINCHKTKTDVDQNGTQHLITETFVDANGRTVSTKNFGGTTGSIWTKFNYNAIGELMSYTDAENLTTEYEYDMFGRKLSVKHPDSGKTNYKYDNVNLVAIQTQNLIGTSNQISYLYDHNRLKEVLFPPMPTGANISNVTYQYGNSGNETGRLIFVSDATGTQEYKYGNMGETIEVNRTIVAPNLPTRNFTTNFEYDSFNRVQKLIYPDGEIVSYLYNRGGNLKQMKSSINGVETDYIKRIDYDYFEQKKYMKYGNNTETFYDYSPELRRLQTLNVKAANGQNMFNNSYTYDKVGNLTNVSNNATYNTINYLGGVYNSTFTYDNLNRLSTANGDFTGYIPNRAYEDNRKSYSLEMMYNDTHGIIQKKQVHTTQGYLPVYENSYTNNYDYQAGTHRAVKITNVENGIVEQLKYDNNGNMLSSSNPDGFRRMYWDEVNRLRVVNDNNQSLQHYIYDAAGERTLKASSKVEKVFVNGQITSSTTTMGLYTTYVSPYMVVDADQRYSNHYFNGSERIVSRMGTQDISLFEQNNLPVASTQNQNVQKSGTPKTQNQAVDYNAIKNLQIADFNYYINQQSEGSNKVKVNYKEYKVADTEIEDASENEKLPAAPLPLEEIYYYHSDHLGTGTFLSDNAGNPYQFFLNLPFGETMIEQHSYSGDYTNRYKFNGKELDEETGYYYYGARYYNPRFSIWLSVDPLAEKFPNWNPYNYVMQNPINLTDPTGMEPEEGGGDPGKKNWLGRQWDKFKSWFSSDKPRKWTIEVGDGTMAYVGVMSLETEAATVAAETTTTAAAASGMSASSLTLLGIPLLFQGDTDDRQKRKDDVIYRYMKPDLDGSPKVGPKYGLLGVRPNKDIKVEEDGTVGSFINWTGVEGLSINRMPTNDRSNPSDYTIYSLDPKLLPPGLDYSWDSYNHGVIYPTENMSLSKFQTLLSMTKYFWKPVK